jgi:Tfp pilus assembly protein PilF
LRRVGPRRRRRFSRRERIVCGLRPVMRASSGMLTRAAATASCSIMARNLASTQPAYKNLVQYALVEYIGSMNTKQALREAEEMAELWTYRGNVASERGESEKAERHYERAQKWLDKTNRLLGNGDGSDG